jgi:hypothetical protein
MSLRSLSLTSLLAIALLAGSASADRLLVGGPAGSVFQADTAADAFYYFAASGTPIEATAADKTRLYAADALGAIHVFDLESGAALTSYTPPSGPFTALATGEGALFAGNAAGEVVRIDPATGVELDSRVMPAGVATMLGHRGFLYAGGADGALYRAPMTGGDFTYFTCFCFFDLQAMSVQEDTLFVVDAFGTLAHVDLASGDIEHAVWVGQTNAMAVHDGAFLVHAGAGVIERRDMQTGQVLPGGYTSPVDIGAMLVLPEPMPAGDLSARVRPSK